MKLQVRPLASLSGSGVAVSVGHRGSSDPALLWLWYKPAAAPRIQSAGAELEKKKSKFDHVPKIFKY